MLNMGLTPDQKIDLAIAYAKKCDDIDLLIPLLNAAHDRINELIDIEHILKGMERDSREDIQE
jgi:hypothetical protein